MNHGGSSDPASALLEAAVGRGMQADLEAWAMAGRPGLEVLRDVLTTDRKLESRDVSQRDAIDNLSAAVAAIAAAFPQDFLDVFSDTTFDANGFVLTGLGYVDDPTATHRLAQAAKSRDRWTRMDAAIGLGRRSSTVAVASLIELVGDPESLVRTHALRGLAEIGDETALAALRDLVAATAYEAELVTNAIAVIESRLAAAG